MANKSGPAAKIRPSRREQVAARTREEILMAAARCLARSEFGSVSLQQIAAEVGFTAPALYAYFSSKEEIFVELVRLLQRELAVTFAPSPSPELPLRARVTLLIRQLFEWTDRRRDVFRAFLALRSCGEGGLVKSAEREDDGGPTRFLGDMIRWMRAEVSDPAEIGGHDPEVAGTLLYGICHAFFIRWLAHSAAGRIADETERVIEFTFRALSGPAPSPAGRSSRRRTGSRSSSRSRS